MGSEGEVAEQVEGEVHRDHRGVHPVLQEGAGAAKSDGGLHVPGDNLSLLLIIRFWPRIGQV